MIIEIIERAAPVAILFGLWSLYCWASVPESWITVADWWYGPEAQQ